LDYWMAYGDAAQNSGDLNAALSAFAEATALMPLSAAAWLQLGEVQAQKNLLTEALESFRKALELSPDSLEGNFNAGLILAKRGELGAARTHFEKALTIQPDHAESLNNIAWLDYKDGKLADAAAKWAQLSHRLPEDGEILANLAATYTALGESEQALKTWLRVTKLRPKDGAAFEFAAQLMAESGKLDDAASLLKEGLANQADNWRLFLALGYIQIQQKLWRDAAASFASSLKLNPQQASARNNLGVCYENLGNLEAAKNEYKRALQIDPEHKDAKTNLERVSGGG
jgi:Flp pilus assembly protein TadD